GDVLNNNNVKHGFTPCNSMHRHILANNQYVTIALSPLTTPIPQATNPHPAPEPCSGRITGILRPLLAAKQSAARMRAVVRRCFYTPSSYTRGSVTRREAG